MTSGKKKVEIMEIPAFVYPKLSGAASMGSRYLANWVWQHSKTEFLWMCLAMTSAVGVSSLSAVTLLYAKKFIDMIAGGFAASESLRTLGIATLIFLSCSILKLISATLGALAATNIRRNLEVACFRHLSALPYDYLEGKSSGCLTAALMNEVPMVSSTVETVLRSFVRAPLTILTVAAALFYISPSAAAASLVLLPVMFAGLRHFSSLAKRASAQAFEKLSLMYAGMNEHIAGLRVVRSMGLIGWYTHKMKDLSYEIALQSRRGAVLSAFQQTVQELISLIMIISFLFWLSWRVVDGTMLIRQALLVPVALLLIRDEILSISRGVMNLHKTAGAVARLDDLLQMKKPDGGTLKLKEGINVIRLGNVTFHYDDGGENVLQDVSLDLYTGLTVVVGESGAGKSTLCDLCLGFRQPTVGKIIYNDVELKDLDEAFLRAGTALVEQEPYLFEGTIRHNLLLGNDTISEEEIWVALHSASAAGFVKALPKGLDSEIGEKGMKLSCGQKQRIALARALLKNPRFLVLDEFTSSLDLENEYEILQAILKLSEKTIILCATHRSSVIKNAREVYRLSDKKLRKITAQVFESTLS